MGLSQVQACTWKAGFAVEGDTPNMSNNQASVIIAVDDNVVQLVFEFIVLGNSMSERRVLSNALSRRAVGAS